MRVRAYTVHFVSTAYRIACISAIRLLIRLFLRAYSQRAVVPDTAATMYFWKNRYNTKIGRPAKIACAMR